MFAISHAFTVESSYYFVGLIREHLITSAIIISRNKRKTDNLDIETKNVCSKEYLIKRTFYRAG